MLDRRRVLMGMAAAGAGLGAAPEAWAAAGDITLTEQDGRFLVGVRLNGQAYRFVLDTGASTHFISSAIAERLRLPQVDSRSISSYGGRKVEPIVALGRLDVGGVQLPATRAVAWSASSMEGHDGLVGYPILGARACLDLQARRLSLGAPPPPSDAVEVDAEVSSSETMLVGGVDGTEGRFVLAQARRAA